MPLFTSHDSEQDFTQLSIFTHRPFVIQDMSSSIVMFTRDLDNSFTVYIIWKIPCIFARSYMKYATEWDIWIVLHKCLYNYCSIIPIEVNSLSRTIFQQNRKLIKFARGENKPQAYGRGKQQVAVIANSQMISCWATIHTLYINAVPTKHREWCDLVIRALLRKNIKPKHFILWGNSPAIIKHWRR